MTIATKWDIYRNTSYIKAPATVRTIYVVPPPTFWLKLKRWSIEHQQLYLKKTRK